jgi:putative DNA primase/helicase
MEFMGLCFTTDMNAEKFFYLFGLPAAGKSKVIEFISRCWSRGAVSNVMLDKLGGRFDLSRVEGKMLNIDSDLAEGELFKKSIAAIKGLTGRDTMEAERKFRDSHSFKNTAKLIIASNYPFNDNKREPGLDRRIVEIPFPNQVDESRRDPYLVEKLLQEKEGVVYKCLMNYFKLRASNYRFTPVDLDMYHNRLGFCGNMQSMYIDQRKVGVERFIKGCCVFEDNARVHNFVLYERYLQFCQKSGYQPYNTQKEFTIEMQNILGEERFARFRENGDNTNGVIGLRLIEM